jgi:hypothetical protein
MNPMSRRDRAALVACAIGWVLLGKAAIGVSGSSLQARRRWLDWLAARLPAPPPFTVDEAAWAVTAAARRVPGTRCLAWSLALRGLLGQAGIASELRIGVAPSQTAAAPAITAHAWVDCGGRTLSWGDAEGYSVLRPRAAVS